MYVRAYTRTINAVIRYKLSTCTTMGHMFDNTPHSVYNTYTRIHPMRVYLRGRVYGREHINFRNDSPGYFRSAQQETRQTRNNRAGYLPQLVVPKRCLVTTSPKKVGEKNDFFKTFSFFVRKSAVPMKIEILQKTTCC